jgi:hypothetical protein
MFVHSLSKDLLDILETVLQRGVFRYDALLDTSLIFGISPCGVTGEVVHAILQQRSVRSPAAQPMLLFMNPAIAGVVRELSIDVLPRRCIANNAFNACHTLHQRRVAQLQILVLGSQRIVVSRLTPHRRTPRLILDCHWLQNST